MGSSSNALAEDLAHTGSVGWTLARTIRLVTAESPLTLELGGRLCPIDMEYETYGVLSATKDNVVFVAHGRMPVTERLPYPWYDSDNIHPFTLQDLLDWVDTSNVRIVAGYSLSEGSVRPLRPEDNLHAEEVLVVVERS